MTLYMVCLYIVSVSRESLGTLTLIMVSMIHPIISVPLGKFANCLYNLMFETAFKKYFQNSSSFFAKFSRRFFTLTLNAYLTFVGGCMYYLFKSSINFRESSEFILVAMNDFKNVIFDKCKCQTKDDNPDCVNDDTNFQNYLTFLPNEVFLLLLTILPFSFHFIHALLVNSPHPVQMLDFILGKTKKHEVFNIFNDVVELEALKAT